MQVFFSPPSVCAADAPSFHNWLVKVCDKAARTHTVSDFLPVLSVLVILYDLTSAESGAL
jgi:hypothetical protein